EQREPGLWGRDDSAPQCGGWSQARTLARRGWREVPVVVVIVQHVGPGAHDQPSTRHGGDGRPEDVDDAVEEGAATRGEDRPVGLEGTAERAEQLGHGA